ncbi:alkaline phosphatase D family protein [Saliphagus infecundisoli]|uniref:Alkaline phosphatase D family protein n=2 Tax=Saliphagus infecundisoli TaxID=1849069 RepID=A0ABD5QAB6_9EURY|nr:alkaline phosphatase D family protein [Saliphagus infecundisoli]
MLQVTGAASMLGLAGCNANAFDDSLDPDQLLALPHGVAVGDTTSETAVFWTRLAEPGTVNLEFTSSDSFDDADRVQLEADADADDTARTRLTGLEPRSEYSYRAWGVAEGGDLDANPPEDEPAVKRGSFRTAPTPDADAPVTFAWSGDTYGYGGAPVEPPYAGLEAIGKLQPDFFLYLGDTIYADANTPAGQVSSSTDPDEALEIYNAKYREMRNPDSSVADRTNLQTMLEATSVYAIWDDHEVINNFNRTNPLLPSGLESFLNYWPLDTHESVTGSSDTRMYRSFRWGKHLELFVLDTRQYRDPSDIPPEEKAMLGKQQLNWLLGSLQASDATFKVIASSTTMGIMSGDGWTQSGQGYGRELGEILNVVEDLDNVLVLSGDIHKAQVAAFDTNDDVVNEFYEASAGPLGAPSGNPNQYYEPFNPNVFYDRGNFNNFGVIQVDEAGDFIWIEIRHENGKIAFSRRMKAV